MSSVDYGGWLQEVEAEWKAGASMQSGEGDDERDGTGKWKEAVKREQNGDEDRLVFEYLRLRKQSKALHDQCSLVLENRINFSAPNSLTPPQEPLHACLSILLPGDERDERSGWSDIPWTMISHVYCYCWPATGSAAVRPSWHPSISINQTPLQQPWPFLTCIYNLKALPKTSMTADIEPHKSPSGSMHMTAIVQTFMNFQKQTVLEMQGEMYRGQGGSLHPLTVLLYAVEL